MLVGFTDFLVIFSCHYSNIVLLFLGVWWMILVGDSLILCIVIL